jgi:nucleoside triphosphate diphosphatase
LGYSKRMDEDSNTSTSALAHEQKRRAGERFTESTALMARLRAPGGCPWDREQTLVTIRKYTLEEVYEVIDAIERENWLDLREELGDLQLQILFYAQIAADQGQFTIEDVLETLNRKLIRRHPHVFGEAAAAAAGNNAELQNPNAATAAHVLRNWDAIKRAEKSFGEKSSILDAVPRSFPALLEAAKLGSKAAKVGFDWPDHRGVLAKLREEMAELEAEFDSEDIALRNQRAVEEELGDLLFTVANLARHLKIDAELALRSANAKFRRRFGAMEAGSPVALEELEA